MVVIAATWSILTPWLSSLENRVPYRFLLPRRKNTVWKTHVTNADTKCITTVGMCRRNKTFKVEHINKTDFYRQH